MFDCKVCPEKDNRIEDLKEQIQYLRAVLNPPISKLAPVESVNLQQDMILDGGGQEEIDPLVDPAESPEVLAERSAMLSGTY